MALLRFCRHLRLQFQFILAPVFLLGIKLAGTKPDGDIVFLFVLVHVGLYGGMTAYNSYYDRDEGPIGGMKHPPKAGQAERLGGLGIQLVSVVAMFFWGWHLGTAGLLLMLMGIAYSHPRWRWKARPLASLLTVTVGQGLLPFYIGLETATGQQAALWEMVVVGLATALIITGLYPLTQVYQIEEDRSRGDYTFAVHYGPRRVFQTARGLVGVGVGLLMWVLWAGHVFQSWWIWLLPFGYATFHLALIAWERRFEHQDVYQNHDWAFRLSLVTSLVFWLFLAVEFIV